MSPCPQPVVYPQVSVRLAVELAVLKNTKVCTVYMSPCPHPVVYHHVSMRLAVELAMYCIYEPLSPASSVSSGISEAGSRASSVKKYKGMYCLYKPMSPASCVSSCISEAGSRVSSVKKKGMYCLY